MTTREFLHKFLFEMLNHNWYYFEMEDGEDLVRIENWTVDTVLDYIFDTEEATVYFYSSGGNELWVHIIPELEGEEALADYSGTVVVDKVLESMNGQQ
jgi:hypothetical protein